MFLMFTNADIFKNNETRLCSSTNSARLNEQLKASEYEILQF